MPPAGLRAGRSAGGPAAPTPRSVTDEYVTLVDVRTVIDLSDVLVDD